jgi:hypothetical protein
MNPFVFDSSLGLLVLTASGEGVSPRFAILGEVRSPFARLLVNDSDLVRVRPGASGDVGAVEAFEIERLLRVRRSIEGVTPGTGATVEGGTGGWRAVGSSVSNAPLSVKCALSAL